MYTTILSRIGCTCIFLLLLSYTSMAQKATRAINGTVKDNSGAVLPGATILIESTEKRTVSDDYGNFKAEVINKGKQRLRVNLLGYHEKTATLEENQTSIEIFLKENVQEIDPVVIVGYASQKKSSITNAVERLDFKDLENVPQSNTIDILAGRIAGLSVTSVGGQPGADDSEVKLRGTVTTGVAISPLIIIDGVQAGLKELSTLAPHEIAEITVLKDASSAAIYGSRGANGVILVTTKAPVPGKSKINLNSSYAWQQGLNLPHFVESWQWMTLQNEAGNTTFTQAEIDQVKAGQYTDELANNDPTSTLFRTAPQVITNLSLSGGSKDLSYQASFGYLNQEGIMKNTQAKRYNYRLNVMAAITKKIDAGINISGYSQNRYQPYTDPKGILRDDVFRSVPITPEKYANGDWGVYNERISIATKPPSLIAEIGNSNLFNQRLTVVPQLIYKPIKNLVLRATLSYTNNINGQESFNPTYLYYAPNGVNALRNNINSLYKFNSTSDQLQLTNLATYNFNIHKKHAFTVLAGYEFMDFKRDRFSVTGTDLATNDKQVFDQVTANIVPTGMKQHWAYQSVFGRLNYAFNSKYFFEANIRRDGSSRLPSHKRYASFPSVSAGWMLSKEKFFSKINPGKIFDQVKFRASWGKTGNDIVGVRNYYQTYEFTGHYTFGDNIYGGAVVHEFSNENLHWITSTTTNIGLDLAMFKNKLNVTLDLYDRMHKGVYFYYNFPPSMGNASERFSRNAANVENKGFEAAIKYRSNINKLNYNVGFTYARNTNKVVSLEVPELIAVPFILSTNIPFNSIYGYVYDGIIKDANELATVPILGGNSNRSNMKVGAMKFKDLNNDGVIDANDRTVLGASQIPHEFGLTGGIRFKAFDMSFLLYAVKGKQVYIRDWGNLPGNNIQSNFWSEWWDNRYDPVNNPEGTWPVFSRTAMGSDQVSSFWVHDADFMRLKNLEIGYTMQPKTLAKLGVSNLRIYFSGQNLFTLTNLIKQVDPERFTRQTNNATYPQVKMFTAGLNISL